MLFPRQTYGCRRISRDTFATAGKAEFLAGGRFYPNAFDADAGKFCDIRAHAVPVLSDPRGFTYNREIEIGNPAATRAHPLDRKDKKAI